MQEYALAFLFFILAIMHCFLKLSESFTSYDMDLLSTKPFFCSLLSTSKKAN